MRSSSSCRLTRTFVLAGLGTAESPILRLEVRR